MNKEINDDGELIFIVTVNNFNIYVKEGAHYFTCHIKYGKRKYECVYVAKTFKKAEKWCKENNYKKYSEEMKKWK